jgi:copper chaperone CopZ
MKTILHIEGMSCGHCVQHVKDALESVAGVKTAEVHLDDKSAVVEHAEGVSQDTLKAAVEEAGFEAGNK